VRAVALAPALAIVVACGKAENSGAGAGAERARIEIGAPVPGYRAISLDGDSVSLAAQRGKVVLLNVWATWCHPCRDEIPELRAVHARYKDRGLELVGVSVDAGGADEQIRAFMKEFAMTYPIWLDPEERVSTQFLIIGVPATFLIDRSGVLRWRKTGPVQPGDTALSNAIERALAIGA
jgi:cytochrome c biogenesis protein CcmG/thiol:disulfide interchange protein DsbE